MQIERIILATSLVIAPLTACDDATDPASSTTRGSGYPALAGAGSAVDPGALTPAPSLVGATADCLADGRWIVCHTLASTELVNEPITDFGLPCGTIYETSTDVRYGIRWYDAADSVIRKRHVRQDVDGFWSGSPDGSGPVVRLTIHANWDDSGYSDPLDLDSGVRQYHGMITINAPGLGNIAIIAGHDEPDGTHHGVLRGIDDPTVAANLCAALAP